MKTKWLVATILSSSLLVPVQTAEAHADQDIRFRVLANSDEAQDLAIKESVYLLVQDQILQTLAGDNLWEREELSEKLEDHVEKWEKLVQQELKANGFSYSATVRFEKHRFPEKHTEDGVYAEGVFDTVIVTLGEGQGTNWWCSIFPDLCGQVLIKKAKAADVEEEKDCESDLSPKKDLRDEEVVVDSIIVNWFQKGWDLLVN
ncbi:stage II sporulation protein R [Jeotgalibacillus sp. ET6]|uniref:stage II sporulation protein R n=1 Tax=Jeotgalibacillus sp. ET6 TaxID=3037260 RepID=UPI00241882FF|nr:stage II sporulation protein R [Jeotgalibacillus sp. ET6]MDG5471167.1 stage II sporulation protein R [Jeotgalibacillus sp. ET6]